MDEQEEDVAREGRARKNKPDRGGNSGRKKAIVKRLQEEKNAFSQGKNTVFSFFFLFLFCLFHCIFRA